MVANEQTRSGLLEHMAGRIRNGLPVSFVKRGDGEEFCMRGDVGENCDFHPYSPELGAMLTKAFEYFETQRSVQVVQWCQQHTYQALLHVPAPEGESIQPTVDFWNAVRNAASAKLFIGPERLEGAARLLRAKHLTVPLVNAFAAHEAILAELMKSPARLFIFCAGMPAKPWIAELLRRRPGCSCIDAGSAWDPLFVGNTRTGQLTQQIVRSFYRESL